MKLRKNTKKFLAHVYIMVVPLFYVPKGVFYVLGASEGNFHKEDFHIPDNHSIF